MGLKKNQRNLGTQGAASWTLMIAPLCSGLDHDTTSFLSGRTTFITHRNRLTSSLTPHIQPSANATYGSLTRINLLPFLNVLKVLRTEFRHYLSTMKHIMFCFLSVIFTLTIGIKCRNGRRNFYLQHTAGLNKNGKTAQGIQFIKKFYHPRSSKRYSIFRSDFVFIF